MWCRGLTIEKCCGSKILVWNNEQICITILYVKFCNLYIIYSYEIEYRISWNIVNLKKSQLYKLKLREIKHSSTRTFVLFRCFNSANTESCNCSVYYIWKTIVSITLDIDFISRVFFFFYETGRFYITSKLRCTSSCKSTAYVSESTSMNHVYFQWQNKLRDRLWESPEIYPREDRASTSGILRV